MGELDGKVAIVTGAGRLRGIGRAAAVALAKQGADVAVTGTGRDPKTFPEDERRAGWRDVESNAEQVRAQGRRALPLTGDVANAGDVQRMVETTLKELGRVDILINNAAYARGPDRVPVTQLDERLFRRVLEVKGVGTVYIRKSRDAGTPVYRNVRPPERASGERLPSIEPNARPEGSVADVAARGRGSRGVWSLELARRLDTGNADDVAFRAGSRMLFQIAVFNRNSDENKSISEPLALDLGALR